MMYVSLPEVRRRLEDIAIDRGPNRFFVDEHPLKVVVERMFPRIKVLDVLEDEVEYIGYKRGGAVKALPLSGPVQEFVHQTSALGQDRISIKRAIDIAEGILR